MNRLQDVIRLHRLGCSRRVIARRLRMSRDTVARYLDLFGREGVLEGASDALPEAHELKALVERRLPEPPAPQRSSIEHLEATIAELRTRGAMPTAIHDHLRLNDPEYRGSLSAVKRLCRRLDRQAGPRPTDVAIPVETAPGEVAQVDFGYAGMRYDEQRGVLRKAWVFVMTLGFSRHMYADLVFDQKLETWLRLHVDAFEHFGGVPKVIVPDNLKAAVIRAAFAIDDDPVINRSYRELARHYGFQIDPAPPRAPQKKGKVEAGVRYVCGNFLSTWATVDLSTDRRALHRWVAEVAGRRPHGTTKRPPLEVFEECERSALLALARQRWDRVVWKKAVLHRDCHVQVDGAFYSAPWQLLRQELWIRCSTHRVAIYHDDELLWTHQRVPRGHRSTVEQHLPEHRAPLRLRSKQHWIDRAEAIGPEVKHLAESIFGSDDVLLKLRKVQAVVSHLEVFPKTRARAAAARAIHFGSIEYRSIKSILRQGLDLEPLPQSHTRAWSQGSRFARRHQPALPYQ